MKKIFKYLAAAIGILVIISCTDMNNRHQEWLDRGEGVYIGKIDSVDVYPGIGRVKFEWEIKADPRIAKVEIAWMEGAEIKSREYSVTRTDDGRFMMNATIENIPEGNYSFEFTTMDGEGNRSKSSPYIVDIYGEQYQRYMAHRYAKATRLGNGTAIVWQAADSTLSYVDLFYTDTEGVNRKMRVLPEDERTVILHEGNIDIISVYKSPNELDTLRATKKALPLSNNLQYTVGTDVACEIPIVHFDLGGEGVGYHDNDPNNRGGNAAYRNDMGDSDCGVDVEGNLNTGYSDPGEWMQYTVNVEEEGDYFFDVNLSVNGGSAAYSLIVNGEKTAICNMRNNSSWNSWRWYHASNRDEPQLKIHLKKGRNEIRFFLDGGGYNIMKLSLTHSSLAPPESPDSRVTALSPALYYAFTDAAHLTRPSNGTPLLELFPNPNNSDPIAMRLAPEHNPDGSKKAVLTGKNDHIRVKNPGSAPLYKYTMMWDIKYPVKEWYALLNNHLGRENDATLFIRSDGGIGRSSYSSPIDENKWYRIVLVVDVSGSNKIYKVYLDGTLVLTNTSGVVTQTDMGIHEYFWIFTDGIVNGDPGEENDIYCAGYAMWTDALSEEQILALGGTVQ